MNHEQIQPLLTLSAAGLLDAEGERAIGEHARECPECAAQLEALSALSAALASRPAPEMPALLMLRTRLLWPRSSRCCLNSAAVSGSPRPPLSSPGSSTWQPGP